MNDKLSLENEPVDINSEAHFKDKNTKILNLRLNMIKEASDVENNVEKLQKKTNRKLKRLKKDKIKKNGNLDENKTRKKKNPSWITVV